ncbi:hypothetical protein L218DRAFT_938165 [Marasmius fiardii PR-910]|nr:hypothetical protein L218DRAFT_938165 [Marasmius fiardii PR-910]
MSSQFPHVGFRLLISLLYFFGLSILAHCISRRTQSIWPIRESPWARILVVVILIDSWLFLFASGILVFGIGLETLAGTCTAAIVVCMVLYCSSKALIYAFLMERVHLVWSPRGVGRRLHSPVFLLCMGFMSVYIVVIILMSVGAIHRLREDGKCVIGLESYSSLPVLGFDLSFTIFLNALFLWPLYRSKINSPLVRAVTTRTLVASIIGLITSTVNIAILAAMKHGQLGWICLGSCGLDVMINALVIFWVTGGNGFKASTGNDALDGHELEGLELRSLSQNGRGRSGLYHHPASSASGGGGTPTRGNSIRFAHISSVSPSSSTFSTVINDVPVPVAAHGRQSGSSMSGETEFWDASSNA